MTEDNTAEKAFEEWFFRGLQAASYTQLSYADKSCYSDTKEAFLAGRASQQMQGDMYREALESIVYETDGNLGNVGRFALRVAAEALAIESEESAPPPDGETQTITEDIGDGFKMTSSREAQS